VQLGLLNTFLGITNSRGRGTHVTRLYYQATRITLHSDGRRRSDRCYFNLSLLNFGFVCTSHIWRKRWMGASSFASQGCAVHKHVEDVLVKPKSLCSEYEWARLLSPRRDALYINMSKMCWWNRNRCVPNAVVTYYVRRVLLHCLSCNTSHKLSDVWSVFLRHIWLL